VVGKSINDPPFREILVLSAAALKRPEYVMLGAAEQVVH